MKTSDFDYFLPRELIAQRPTEPRDGSRLMVLKGGNITHLTFRDIAGLLGPGDVLVVNDTKVIPAKLIGKKASGGRVEVLFVKKSGDGACECLVKGKNIRENTNILFDHASARVTRISGGRCVLELDCDMDGLIDKSGSAPLPPYIKEPASLERYQTVYARNRGSIAAPTAGLHFTPRLLEEIERKGVTIANVTLHVGPGTFAPVSSDDVERHAMEPEYFSVGRETADAVNCREGRLIAAGTTTVKALESAYDGCALAPREGWSDLFIRPPYMFRNRIDALITNFHLPKSTLIMLASAYAGRERLRSAYECAVMQKYRFYSFGDAMIIFREEGGMRE
ncbi:MAG TPA: tRNA preQ1(34) S-adenosylmethionine ribosyltransferase-isomerase QueA [Candidatus Methanoperedenaceae archaeon]|nr:tRNA preQ1(34) S-adenosylmethionine ribosyltransferase-isomerase QueA [Candidatus Methanoperedenaceae archaeon]